MGHGDMPMILDQPMEIIPRLMNDEQLRETSVAIAAALVSPASSSVVSTGHLFEIADEIGNYIRTGQHQKEKDRGLF